MLKIDHFKEILSLFGDIIDADETLSDEERREANTAINFFESQDFSSPDALEKIMKEFGNLPINVSEKK